MGHRHWWRHKHKKWVSLHQSWEWRCKWSMGFVLAFQGEEEEGRGGNEARVRREEKKKNWSVLSLSSLPQSQSHMRSSAHFLSFYIVSPETKYTLLHRGCRKSAWSRRIYSCVMRMGMMLSFRATPSWKSLSVPHYSSALIVYAKRKPVFIPIHSMRWWWLCSARMNSSSLIRRWSRCVLFLCIYTLSLSFSICLSVFLHSHYCYYYYYSFHQDILNSISLSPLFLLSFSSLSLSIHRIHRLPFQSIISLLMKTWPSMSVLYFFFFLAGHPIQFHREAHAIYGHLGNPHHWKHVRGRRFARSDGRCYGEISWYLRGSCAKTWRVRVGTHMGESQDHVWMLWLPLRDVCQDEGCRNRSFHPTHQLPWVCRWACPAGVVSRCVIGAICLYVYRAARGLLSYIPMNVVSTFYVHMHVPYPLHTRHTHSNTQIYISTLHDQDLPQQWKIGICVGYISFFFEHDSRPERSHSGIASLHIFFNKIGKIRSHKKYLQGTFGHFFPSIIIYMYTNIRARTRTHT